MTKLILSFIFNTLLLIFTGVWIKIKQPEKNGKELVVVAEVGTSF